MLTIHLNTDWTCDYFELEPDLYEFQDYRATVTRLSDWRFEKRYPEGWAAWLERRFHLSPTEECVRYELHLDAVPAGAELSVNGRVFGQVAVPCALDITDYVTLDENRIAFRVPAAQPGEFGTVRLVAIPCD